MGGDPVRVYDLILAAAVAGTAKAGGQRGKKAVKPIMAASYFIDAVKTVTDLVNGDMSQTGGGTIEYGLMSVAYNKSQVITPKPTSETEVDWDEGTRKTVTNYYDDKGNLRTRTETQWPDGLQMKDEESTKYVPKVSATKEASGDTGVRFPILESAENLNALILGIGSAPLIQWDLDASAWASLQVDFPLPIPLLTIRGTVSIETGFNLGLGKGSDCTYDFIRRLDFTSMNTLQSSARGNLKILREGLCFDDHYNAATGQDDPEAWVKLSFGVGPALNLSYGIGEIDFSIDCGFRSDINFDLNDLPMYVVGENGAAPVNAQGVAVFDPADYCYDHWVTLDEIKLARQVEATAFFEVGGALSFGVDAFVRAYLGWGVFRLKIIDQHYSIWNKELVPYRIHTPPSDRDILAGVSGVKPVLGAVDGSGQLTLYTGSQAGQRKDTPEIGTSDGSETV